MLLPPSNVSDLTIVSAPALSTLPQCFLEGTCFQRAPTNEVVQIGHVRKGDCLCGPDGKTLVLSNSRKEKREYDIVDFRTDAGILSVTADHRIVLVDGRACAAAEAPTSGYLAQKPGCAVSYHSSRRVASVVVYDLMLENDKAVFVVALAHIAATRGGPGENWSSYSSCYYTDCEKHPGKSASAPSTVFRQCPVADHDGSQFAQPYPLEPPDAFSEIRLKHRKKEGPTVIGILSQLAQRAGCGHLLDGLRSPEEDSTCVVHLPTQQAVQLERRIKEPYSSWQTEQSSMRGRSSILVWRHGRHS